MLPWETTVEAPQNSHFSTKCIDLAAKGSDLLLHPLRRCHCRAPSTSTRMVRVRGLHQTDEPLRMPCLCSLPLLSPAAGCAPTGTMGSTTGPIFHPAGGDRHGATSESATGLELTQR